MSEHPLLQKLMRKHHLFLFKLYRQKSGRKNRQVLQKARKQQVWLVLRLLFCISAGHIPLSRANYERLVKSKRRNNLRSLKNQMRYLKKATVERQKNFILQFSALYHYLFHDIFVKV